MKPVLIAAAAVALTLTACGSGLPAYAADRVAPRSYAIPLPAGTTSLTVEVSGKGRICGPARVADQDGHLILALAAGHCISTER